jgi:hypothetical protein
MRDAFRDSAWLRRAECALRGLDPRLFSPAPSQPVDARVIAACASCAVQLDCLSAALREEEAAHARPAGIRGGYTAEARTHLRRRTRRAQPVWSPAFREWNAKKAARQKRSAA